MVMWKKRLAALIVLVALGNSISAAESNQWLFNVRYSVAGIIQTLPTSQKNQCLTEASPVPDISRPGYECKSQILNRFGKTLIWQVDCSNEWESIQGTGRVNFENQKAAGDIHLQIINPTSPPEYMVAEIKGKAVGACKK